MLELDVGIDNTEELVLLSKLFGIGIMQQPALGYATGASCFHSFLSGSYCSTSFKYCTPSNPPMATIVFPKTALAIASRPELRLAI